MPIDSQSRPSSPISTSPPVSFSNLITGEPSLLSADNGNLRLVTRSPVQMSPFVPGVPDSSPQMAFPPRLNHVSTPSPSYPPPPRPASATLNIFIPLVTPYAVSDDLSTVVSSDDDHSDVASVMDTHLSQSNSDIEEQLLSDKAPQNLKEKMVTAESAKRGAWIREYQQALVGGLPFLESTLGGYILTDSGGGKSTLAKVEVKNLEPHTTSDVFRDKSSGQLFAHCGQIFLPLGQTPSTQYVGTGPYKFAVICLPVQTYDGQDAGYSIGKHKDQWVHFKNKQQ
ncbi:hypothetical protein ACVBEF_03260 [Glaciimonas sp. GG7]